MRLPLKSGRRGGPKKRVVRIALLACAVLLGLWLRLVFRSGGANALSGDQAQNSADPSDASMRKSAESTWFDAPDNAVVLRTCVRENEECALHFGRHSADGYALGVYQARIQSITRNSALPPVWHIWVSGGMQSQNRWLPNLADGIHDNPHLVMHVPGPTEFAAKAGLWRGMIRALGRERASEICPETWTRDEFPLIPSWAASHPDLRLVLKFGHRQVQIQTIATSDPQLASKVMGTYAKVIQVMESKALVLANGGRVAFRTYTWVRCLSASSAVAVLDLNSPAYLNQDNSSLISSGYTPSTNFTSTAQFMRGHLTSSEQADLRAAMSKAVVGFLQSFGVSMCAFPSPSQVPRSQDVVCELFGFDWLPIRPAPGQLGVKLLETNRFPDMQLHNPKGAIHDKDAVKVCAYLRRLGRKTLASCPPVDEITVAWSSA